MVIVTSRDKVHGDLIVAGFDHGQFELPNKDILKQSTYDSAGIGYKASLLQRVAARPVAHVGNTAATSIFGD